MGLFSFLHKKRLADLRTIERVTVTGVVASPNDLTSPITGLRAACFYVALFERYHEANQNQYEREHGRERIDRLGGVVCGADTLLLTSEPEGLLIEVPVREARFTLDASDRSAQMLERIPPELAPLAAKAKGRGLVCYIETPLTQGDRFELSAMLEPPHGSGSGGYRSAPSKAIVARADLGPIKLKEILDRPSW